MKKKIIFTFSIILALVVNTVFSYSQTLQAVPVIPNEGIIEGRVLGYCIISSSILDIKPDQTLYRLKILVTGSKNVEGKRNLTRDKVGKTIEFYSKEKLSTNFFNQTIKARVVYQGDERGGLYWIKNINILNTEKEESP